MARLGVRLFLALVPVALVVPAVSCSNDAPRSTATNESFACGARAPSTCPDGSVPSYEHVVAPLLDRKCNDCHTGASGKPWRLDNYDDLVHWAPEALRVVEDCSMPPSDAGLQLTSDERTELLEWLGCGAPKN